MPPDIIQEIFYKTPAEALVRSKPTCKEWYGLLTDETFINEHFKRSQERFIRIFDDTVQIMDPVTATSSFSPVPNALRQNPYKITLVYPLMVHCDGLMLVAYDDDCSRGSDGSTRFPNLALWNPVLKNLRWVEPAKGITSSDFHGIGYDKSNRSEGYKILRFTSCPWNVEGYGDAPEVEIYECKTCSWRTLDVELDMDVHIMYNCVAAMGNMYWIAYRDVEEEEFIRSFDFSDETFKDVCFCPPSYDNYQLGCLV